MLATTTIMPKKRMLKLGRKSGKYTLSEEVYVLQVYVADIPLIQCTLRTDSTGSQCMLYVRDKLDLHQWELFSFRFQQRLPDPDRRLWRWVEMDRPLRKQLDKWACRPRQVQLAILYHTPNVFSLSDQTARSLYYTLLKQDVLQAKFSGMELEKYMSLAALSLQVDHPNYDFQLHTTEWLRAQRLLPTSIVAGQPQMLDEFIARIVEFYARLSGMNPTYAAFLYIVDVQQCDGYGDEHWPARDDEGMEVRLGYTLDDVYALRPATGARVGIPWVGVRSVQVSKRVLRVRTTSGGVASDYAYTLENVEMAKYVAMVLDWQWRFATVDAAVHRAVPMSINNLKGSIRTFNGSTYHPRHTGTNSAGGAGSRATNSFDMATAGQSFSQSTTTHTTSHTLHQQIPFYQPMQPVRFQEPIAAEMTRSMLNVNGAVSSIASGSVTQLHVSNPQLHLISGKKLMHSPICRPASASSTSQQRPVAVSLSQGSTPAHLQESQREILKLMLAEKQRLDELERNGVNGGHRLTAGSSPEIHMAGVAGSGGKLAYLMKKVSSPHFLRTPKFVDAAKRVDYNGVVAPQSQSTRMDECIGGITGEASNAASGDCSANMKWRSTPELYSNQLQVLAPNTIVATPLQFAAAAAKRKPNRRQRYARHTAEVHPMMMAAAAAVEYKQEQQSCSKLAASLSHPHGRLIKQKSISQASSPASSQETDSPPNGNALNDGGPLRDGLPVEITAHAHTGPDGRPSFRFPTPPLSPPTPPNYSMGQMITQSGAVRPVNYPLPKSALKQHHGSQQQMHPPSSPPPPPPLPLSSPNCGSKSGPTRIDLHQCQKEASADGMLRYAIKLPSNDLHASENHHHSTRNVLLNGVVAAGATNANGAPKSQHSPPYSRGGGNLGKQEKGEEGSSMLKLLQGKLGVPGAVEMEFDGVPAKRLSAGFSTSQLPENQHRNRECTSSRRVIYPYEDTRVMLHPHKNNPDGYINASNVQWPIDYGSSPSNGGGGGPVLKYIVSQAPMRHTIKDFWQMVWESGTRIIVMLVNPHQLEKADTIPHYWPAGAQGNEEEKLQLDGAGYFVLRLKSATKTAFQTTSVLSLKSLARGERRIIYHLQCADFTAEGVPSSQDTFMGFIDAVTSVKRIVENESIERGEKEVVTVRKRPSLVHQQSSNASSNTTNSSSNSANAANSRVKMTLNGRKRARRSRSIGRSNLSDLSDRIREVTSASHQSLVESGAALMKRLSIGNQSSTSFGSHNTVSVNGNSGTPNSTFYTNPNAVTTAFTTPANRKTAASMLAREPAEEPLTIVHCTDGASESGVYVLIEVLIRCIENNEMVDIAQVLRALRQQRMCLVKNASQYRFVHELIVGLLERSRLI